MNLYRRRKFLASAAVLLVCAFAVNAAAQRRKGHKLRATAVVEVTTDSAGIVATRIIPVTILDEGRFQDASVYKASPRPMAIDTGIVYEGQTAGTPVGYATVVSSTNQNGWNALGRWQLIAAKKPNAPVAAAQPGDDRPILRKGGSSETGSSASTPSATPSVTPQPDTQSEPSAGPDDADRPVLRRRTPPKAEEPAPAATPAKPASPPEGAVPATRTPMVVPGTKTFVAVSDNEPIDTRSFLFNWKPGEEAQMEPKMIKLALAQLPRENAQLTPNSLKNIVMRSFDLDQSNDAVIVLSAEIPGSYLAPGGKTEPGKFVSRYVTVIARVGFEGVPQKLAASVTDSTRLDVAPRLELIDAVDVDGDGPAELLFREYSFDQKSYIIYGVGRSSVTKVFEGASTPLK